jgi:hypothetical protein
LAKSYHGIPISALDPRTFSELLDRMERLIWPNSSSDSISGGTRRSQPPETNSAGAN